MSEVKWDMPKDAFRKACNEGFAGRVMRHHEAIAGSFKSELTIEQQALATIRRLIEPFEASGYTSAEGACLGMSIGAVLDEVDDPDASTQTSP